MPRAASHPQATRGAWRRRIRSLLSGRPLSRLPQSRRRVSQARPRASQARLRGRSGAALTRLRPRGPQVPWPGWVQALLLSLVVFPLGWELADALRFGEQLPPPLPYHEGREWAPADRLYMAANPFAPVPAASSSFQAARPSPGGGEPTGGVAGTDDPAAPKLAGETGEPGGPGGPEEANLPTTGAPLVSLPVRYIPPELRRDAPNIRASSAILLEATTGTVLYAKNEHQRRPPASTTKVLTALLAVEEGRFEDEVTVSVYAASTPGSSADLRAGQKLTLRELLYGLMLNSGNDAAVAIAEHLAGSEQAFAQRMNERARELGAVNSRFVNPHGLDRPGHFSTAFDLAVIAKSALQFPTFAEVVGTRTYGPWWNTNRLLWSFEGAEGVKTGTTSGAGNCLVAAASRYGSRLIAVVLNSPDRWSESVALLDWGFERFATAQLARLFEPVATAPVTGGLVPSVQLLAAQELALVVPNSEVRNLSARVEIGPLRAPIAAGQVVGHLIAQQGDQEVARVELIAERSVARWTPIRALWRALLRGKVPWLAPLERRLGLTATG